MTSLGTHRQKNSELPSNRPLARNFLIRCETTKRTIPLARGPWFSMLPIEQTSDNQSTVDFNSGNDAWQAVRFNSAV